MNATITQIIVAVLLVALAGSALALALYYAEKKGSSDATSNANAAAVKAIKNADGEIAASEPVDDAARSLHSGQF